MTREKAIQVLESMKSKESYNALIDLCNMAIEAIQAIDDCDQCEWCCPSDGTPTIHVVRCKDCEYCGYYWDNKYACRITYPIKIVEENDYCSWAKLKGGNE